MFFNVFIGKEGNGVKQKIADGIELVRIMRKKYFWNHSDTKWGNTVADKIESKQKPSMNRDVLQIAAFAASQDKTNKTKICSYFGQAVVASSEEEFSMTCFRISLNISKPALFITICSFMKTWSSISTPRLMFWSHICNNTLPGSQLCKESLAPFLSTVLLSLACCPQSMPWNTSEINANVTDFEGGTWAHMGSGATAVS